MKIFNLTYCFLFCLSFAFGQTTTITGNVYDGTTSAPLSNYTVTSGLGGNATTNASGFYTLVVPSTSDFHVILAAQNSKCYREKWTWGRKVIDFYLTACNYDRSRDSIALRSLYDNLSGAAWTNPWNTAQPITSWGLAYNTRGGGPIEFVGLDNQNLNGTFPRATTGFANLRDLFGFQFTGNTNLKGTLPSLTNMKQLDWVKIQESGMSGDPLSSIAGLKNIEFLRLTFNTSMSVTFPSTINTDWRNIYNLQLEGVNLSGTIPTALFALPNLQTVGLGQNKLTGTVPNLASGIGSPIKYLILNDNDLDSLPNLSVSTNLTALGVKGNKLTFDDIIPNISKFNAATVYEGSANSFVYAPQDSFFVDTTYRKVIGDPLSIDLKIDGALTSNVYTWSKNGVFFRTTTTNKLIFASLAATDAGVYTCTVTNTNAPLLTLVSRRMTVNVSTTCRFSDSLALVDLYNATNGSNWLNKTNWLTTNPINTWFGITLNPDGCTVKEIRLDNDSLRGTLPNLVLPNLQTLILNNNQLSGSIPNLNLPSLLFFYLDNNQLSGNIPNFSLPNLLYMYFQSNQLTGTIPNFSLDKLQILDVSKNQLNGAIPALNLPNLHTLTLYENQLSGNIPNFNLPNIRSLTLDKNQLTGNIPSFNFPKLTVLWIAYNKLTGSIPNLTLPELSGLSLNNNQLSGSIPSLNLPKLTYLHIYTNQLSGCIPARIKTNCPLITANGGTIFSNPLLATQNWANYWNNNEGACSLQDTSSCRYRDSLGLVALYNSTAGTNWTNRWNLAQAMTTWFGVKLNSSGCVDTVFLNQNNLIGTIPTTIDSLSNLIVLGLGMNRMSGTIPPSLGNITTLKHLDFSFNQLSGTIPASLGNLRQMQKFYIGGNQLTGTIPSSLGNFTQAIDFMLNVNNLSGTIPTELGNLINVQKLLLNENLLTGNIPTSFGNLRRVENLYLYKNQLSGSIPTSFRNLQSVKNLYLYKNQLSGSIPTEIGNLTTLIVLALEENALTGVVPQSLSNLTNLQGLGLRKNLFDSIPKLSNLPLTDSILLDNNKLTFDDIIPVVKPKTTYTPQDSFFIETTINGVIGAPLSIDLKIDGDLITNQYRWSKNGVFSRTSLTNKFIFSSLQPIDTGVWTCQVTNSAAPLLTLQSRKITIKVNCATSATSQTLNPSICPNQTYRSPSGKTFSTAGTKLDTLKNQSGCDSVLFAINLKILTPQYQQATTQFICKDAIYRNKILTRDTAFIDTLRSVGLCDSVITTTPVKVNNASVNNLNLSLCAGGSVTVNGIVYNASKRTGQQILTAASTTGCDSIINISTTFVSNLSAIDDDFTIRDTTNTLTFNVLTNDVYSGSVKTTPLTKPATGRLDTLGVGRFTYSVPPQANGTTGFNYRLCSVGCPNVCDTATVRITIIRPRLNGDVSLGITPDCICPNERLIFSELELNPDKFPNNELVIISRWGDVVYRAKPYKNDWTGANDKGVVLPAGTYYYIMRLDLANSKIKTGDVTIYR